MSVVKNQLPQLSEVHHALTEGTQWVDAQVQSEQLSTLTDRIGDTGQSWCVCVCVCACVHVCVHECMCVCVH